MNKRNPLGTQQGVATLVITVIILFIATLVVIYAARVGVNDQRMSSNEARYKEAFATAEAGLDFAAQRFVSNFKNDNITMSYFPVCNSCNNPTNGVNYPSTIFNLSGNAAGGGEASFQVSGCRCSATPPYTNDNLTFTSTATGADGTGTATVRRQLTMMKILGGKPPDVPVMVAGSMGSGGNFNIVANSNGGGPGVPVSIWTGPQGSGANVEFSSNSTATCHIGAYSGNNPQCTNPSGVEKISSGITTLTTYNPSYPDVLPNNRDFPDDIFQYLFGVERTKWQSVRTMADNNDQVISDCSDSRLTATDADGKGTAGEKSPLWWVTGDCSLGPNTVVGSEEKPVILVIDNSTLRTTGGGSNPCGGKCIYGIVYIFQNPDPTQGSGTPGADMQGTPVIYGAFISDGVGISMSGSYSIVYKPSVMAALNSGSGSNFEMAYVPGSWRDY